MNYSELSDFDFNMLVAKTRYPNATRIGKAINGFPPSCIGDERKKAAFYELDNQFNPEKYKESLVEVHHECLAKRVDYCNNARDAWAIIEVNQIAVIPPTLNGMKKWKAYRFYHGDCGKLIEVIDSSPFRAAMIVYLKMQEAA